MEEGMIMEQQPQQQEENGLDSSFSAPRNSKRQRRPSVRLGEIGDVPLALFLENRPSFKRRKKRAAAAAQVCPSLLPDVVEEEVEDDPTAVDMTGFHLQEALESPPSKTKALELVHDAEERKSGENGNEAEMIEQAAEVEEHDQAAENGEDEEEKGRKKSSSSSSFTVKNWGARKVVAAGEEDGSKSSSLAKENEEIGAEVEARESKEEEMEEAREEAVEEEEELPQDQEELEVEEKNASQGLFDQANESDALVEAIDPEERLLEEGDGGDGENFPASGVREENQSRQVNREEEREEEVPETRTQQTTSKSGELNQEESFVLPELVRKWLEERRLAKYMDVFELHEVDEEALPLLTMEDLREMGIHAVGSRRRMFHAILSLSSRSSD
ncbi:golgin subfamily A member 6-like protein 7 [Selaginella moellendorffii]|uniref:golgin subfamily A member 6-like protein 7 n=1 Tax=Selaginella moellendorffii TaxID=88036 RepID=UPI000D1CD32E|nr:golgin subfamily A member 6-like protein 7 [Selaginella moellendorffii]|eukprot:XP_024531692.1 golgin subfamily A member 6-like protein 7 [Selaginella moellendorffii]